MNKKIILLLFAAYCCGISFLVLKTCDFPTPMEILKVLFLCNYSYESLITLNFFSYILLFGLYFCTGIYILSDFCNITDFQWLLSRVKSRKIFLFSTIRKLVANLLSVLVCTAVGFCGAFTLNNMFCKTNLEFWYSSFLLVINAFLFFIGLSVFCFIIKLKFGNTRMILTAVIVLSVCILLDYQIPGFSILTIGNFTQEVTGLALSMAWLLTSLFTASFAIRKLDLA